MSATVRTWHTTHVLRLGGGGSEPGVRSPSSLSRAKRSSFQWADFRPLQKKLKWDANFLLSYLVTYCLKLKKSSLWNHDWGPRIIFTEHFLPASDRFLSVFFFRNLCFSPVNRRNLNSLQLLHFVLLVIVGDTSPVIVYKIEENKKNICWTSASYSGHRMVGRSVNVCQFWWK